MERKKAAPTRYADSHFEVCISIESLRETQAYILDRGKTDHNPQPKAVAVSDVSFTGVRGTSSDEQAITLDCAAIGCNSIRMVRVAISSSVAGEAKHSVLQECSWNIRLYGACDSMPLRESICWEVLDTVIKPIPTIMFLCHDQAEKKKKNMFPCLAR
ncbi:hypothetical protein OIU79_011419 [Salix purpurea]|uniref:Uncharacterized protein n=1 Tax=Salix purpurea TaxID=77065 RepID=A0A9Q0Q0M6_SALPP|nr:hypothetical protein OIU79_011419 [Salix purpurea]